MAHEIISTPATQYRDYILGTKIKTTSELRSALKMVFFDSFPDDICNEIEFRLRGAGKLSDEDFYKLKNSSMEKSIAVSSALDAPFLSLIFDNFDSFGDNLGKEVLVVGCEAGIEANYLALIYPDKHITGIDRCAPAIENARELAAKFEIKNADYYCSEIEIFKHEPFDSIVSVCVMHEALHSAVGLNNPFKLLEEKSQLAYNDLKNIVKKMGTLLRPGGWLASCERLVNGELYGYLRRLHASGICDLAVSIFDISDNTDDSFIAFVDGYRKEHENNVYDVWRKAMDTYCNANGGEVHGAAAQYLKYSRAGKVIWGFEAVKNGKLCARIGVYESVKDKLAVIAIIEGIGGTNYYNYDASNTEAVIKSLKEAETNYKLSPGFTVRKIGASDCDEMM